MHVFPSALWGSCAIVTVPVRENGPPVTLRSIYLWVAIDTVLKVEKLLHLSMDFCSIMRLLTSSRQFIGSLVGVFRIRGGHFPVQGLYMIQVHSPVSTKSGCSGFHSPL